MAGVSTSLSIRDRMTKELNKIAQANSNLNKMLETTDRLSESVGGSSTYRRMTGDANTAAGAIEDVNKKQKQTEEGANKIKNAWGGIGGLVKGVIAAFGVRQTLGLADGMTQTTARLDLMNDRLQTTAELQERIFASANRSRASYQATADAVSKLGITAKDAFSSNEELIAFTEQVNKQFAIAGTDAQGMSNAMLQLTQAMGSGVLRGDELNSIFEQAPTIIQTIADYMEVPIGQIRTMASEGMLTAETVKHAMLWAADETNAKFAKIPMTFAQIGAIAKNILLEAFLPMIQGVGLAAQWIYDNWSTIAPIFYGVAAAVLVYAAALGVQTAATWIADGAARTFFATLLTNPLIWIALVIGVVIGAIYRWVQSVGGLQIAWKIAMDALLTSWDRFKIGFSTGVVNVMVWAGDLGLSIRGVFGGIRDFVGDTKVTVLTSLQGMVNGAIDLINKLITTVNKIPGVAIDTVDHVTFAASAAIENNAAKQARANELADVTQRVHSEQENMRTNVKNRNAKAEQEHIYRQKEIGKMQQDVYRAANAGSGSVGAIPLDPYSGGIDNIDKVGEVGKINEDVNIAEEDLKFIRDVAEMRYVQNFVTLTPTVAVDAQISESVDLDEVVNRLERKLEDEFVMAAEGVYN